MPKVRNIDEALEKFAGSDYFVISDDGGIENVRFLHNDIEDEMYYIVHEVKIDGRDQYVECTEEVDCPLCQKGKKPFIKLFIQLETQNDGKRRIWDRGKTFIKQIQAAFNQNGPLFNRLYDVQRHGGKDDRYNVRYELLAYDEDGTTPDDLTERDTIVRDNGIVWPMPFYLQSLSGGAPANVTPRQAPARGGEDIF